MSDSQILVTQSSMPPIEEYVEEIKDLWDSRWLTNYGSKHKELEKELKEFLNVKSVSLVVNGHNALETILDVWGINEGEIITTPFTFISTTHSILRKGCTPVFCDIKEDDFTIDPDKIEDLITDKTVAIMPVHVYGNICDNEKIMNIAKKHNLKVFYDAAHAVGIKKDGVNVANYGDASMFSFHATKVFHTIEGGAIACNDESKYEPIKHWNDFGITGYDSAKYVGGNAKMNEFCAAMGLCNLRHLKESIAKRKKIVEKYRERLGNIKGIQLSVIQENVENNYGYMPVIFHEKDFGISRDVVASNLEKNNIFPRKYFYPLTSEFESVKNSTTIQNTPIAKMMSESVLTLPLYEDLSIQTVDEICDIVLAK